MIEEEQQDAFDEITRGSDVLDINHRILAQTGAAMEAKPATALDGWHNETEAKFNVWVTRSWK